MIFVLKWSREYYLSYGKSGIEPLCGRLWSFQEVYAVKKAQLEAAYRRQQQEISELKDFVARNKARVSTRNMAMSRQKSWIRWMWSSLRQKDQSRNSISNMEELLVRCFLRRKDLVTGYDEPLSNRWISLWTWTEIDTFVGTNWNWKTTLLKSILGFDSFFI